jgi:hypothetical protein
MINTLLTPAQLSLLKTYAKEHGLTLKEIGEDRQCCDWSSVITVAELADDEAGQPRLAKLQYKASDVHNIVYINFVRGFGRNDGKTVTLKQFLQKEMNSLIENTQLSETYCEECSQDCTYAQIKISYDDRFICEKCFGTIAGE